MRSDPTGSLERHLPRMAPTEQELFAMRRAAWRKQGIVVIKPTDVCDEWTRQAIVNEATRLSYVRFQGMRVQLSAHHVPVPRFEYSRCP